MMRLGRDMLVVEGAMGTMLQQAGLSTESIAPEYISLIEPETIKNIHRFYAFAGADCAISNTFGASEFKLAEYNLEDQLEQINRTGVKLARAGGAPHILADIGPSGLALEPIGEATLNDVFDAFERQAKALAMENPDAFLLETFTDIAEIRMAIFACKKVAPKIPVIASITCNDAGRMELSGTDPATAAIILEAAGADAVGLNCGLGPEQMLPLIESMTQATRLPVVVQPNAGLPIVDEEGNTVYPGTAEEMGAFAKGAYQMGVAAIGSCCGSTPDFTGAIADELYHKQALPTEGRGFDTPVVAGPRRHVVIGQGDTKLIGERINPTGKAELTEELLFGSLDTALRYAREQEAEGADLLDINVGAAGVDEYAMLPEVVRAVNDISTLPLVFDSRDPEALEAALRIYPGRALINSVNGDPASFEPLFALAKKFGACMIVLALDENGIPDSAQGRLEVIETLRARARASGLGDERLLVDSLVMAQAIDAEAPEVTLETMRLVKQTGLATVLGISNVSYGMGDRAEVNAEFFEAAKAVGLDAAIVNPAEVGEQAAGVRTEHAPVEDLTKLSMEELAEKFKSGEIFLPQLMVAIDALKEQRPRQALSSDKRPVVLFATVKGDIHSIGKDICVSLLDSQGYRVIDMGVDVSTERILNATRQTDPVAVCLSALMTTTLPNMKATIDAMHEEFPAIPVCVGGAVVTDAWATGNEAEYSSDAPSCVTLVRSIEQAD